MSESEQIEKGMEEVVAKVFRQDKEHVAQHHELRFKEDLNANSKHYFPIIAYFEENFDIYMDYHAFQYAASTIQSAIDYVIKEFASQKG